MSVELPPSVAADPTRDGAVDGPSPSPCAGCRAPCCRGEGVRLGPRDLHRLVRGLGLAWQVIAEVEETSAGPILLDARGGEARVALRLRPRVVVGGGRRCPLLLELTDGSARCGAHALRPSSCRVYPYHVELYRLSADYDVSVGAGAACPPEGAGGWRLVAPGAPAWLDEEVAEQALAVRVLRRWEEAVRGAGRRFEIGEFIDWSGRVYDVLESLRGGPRDAFQLDAYRVVEAFPSPRVRGGRP